MKNFLKKLFGYKMPAVDPTELEKEIKDQIIESPIVEDVPPFAVMETDQARLDREKRESDEKHDRAREERLRKENMR